MKALPAVIFLSLLTPLLASCSHTSDLAGLKDCSTRAASAKALAARYDTSDLPALIGALNPGAGGMDCSADPVADPTPAVAAAVASYGSGAVDPLLVALKNNGTKGGAAMALADIGDKRAVEPLLIELSSALTMGYQVDPAVLTALGKLGDERAVPYLEEAATRRNGFAGAASALAALQAHK